METEINMTKNTLKSLQLNDTTFDWRLLHCVFLSFWDKNIYQIYI